MMLALALLTLAPATMPAVPQGAPLLLAGGFLRPEPGRDSQLRNFSLLFDDGLKLGALRSPKIADVDNLLPGATFDTLARGGSEGFLLFGNKSPNLPMLSLMMPTDGQPGYDAGLGNKSNSKKPFAGRCFYVTGPKAVLFFERDSKQPPSSDQPK